MAPCAPVPRRVGVAVGSHPLFVGNTLLLFVLLKQLVGLLRTRALAPHYDEIRVHIMDTVSVGTSEFR
jgi:hypothetical protein